MKLKKHTKKLKQDNEFQPKFNFRLWLHDLRYTHRHIKRFFQRLRHGYSEADLWDLDSHMVEAIYERVKNFLEVNEWVDLTYHHMTIDDETKTQEEWIDELLKCCENYLLDVYHNYDLTDDSKTNSNNFLESEMKSGENESRIWNIWLHIHKSMWI